MLAMQSVPETYKHAVMIISNLTQDEVLALQRIAYTMHQVHGAKLSLFYLVDEVCHYGVEYACLSVVRLETEIWKSAYQDAHELADLLEIPYSRVSISDGYNLEALKNYLHNMGVDLIITRKPKNKLLNLLKPGSLDNILHKNNSDMLYLSH